MGMKVTWLTACEECGEKWKRVIGLTNDTRYGYSDSDGDIKHPYMEVWSPGIPP